ncbi:hypothetical protein BLX24_23450 [Arsenicibacter rosenii]|uniref:pPIWI-RE three-gene island domain-containing protein n=2 Tax=Arsenicibacter rosenii TaxID=1750698 RepID=A0A1S2VFU2_9BACT|nr:hypothetical protein BLX24_23450 [Arsenicibacter rosenii]
MGRSTGSAETRPHRKPASLSANQLMAVELGLYLLAELTPTASPAILPGLLTTTTPSDVVRPVWTAKQLRYLNRARLLIGQFMQPALWQSQLERYANLPEHLQAYDISQDRARFSTKKVGFSRNRIFTLKRLFD